MASLLSALPAWFDRQAPRLVHAVWLGLVCVLALGLSAPLTTDMLMVLLAAAMPGILGLVLGGGLKAHRKGARFVLALAWTLPGLAVAVALGTALSPAALVFLAGPMALSASGLRQDVRLTATMSAMAFLLIAGASLLGPLGAGVAGLSADVQFAALGGVGLAVFFALNGFVARVRLLQHIDRQAARLKEVEPAAEGFAMAPSPMMALDLNGRIHAASRSLRRFTPGAPRNLKGLPVEGLAFDDAGRDDITTGLHSARQGDDARGEDFIFAVRAANGARTPLSARAVATETGYVVCVDPETETECAADTSPSSEDATRLMAERDAAIAANRSKSEFLAAVSHELRTPLNAIIGFSDIIKQRLFGPLPARYAEYGDLIHESGEHLLELIGDVLDMSKIEADRYELTEESFDARDVVSICAKMIGPRAKDRGLALYCEPGDMELPVVADRKAMRQVLLNLLSNAVKFTPSGGAVVVMARQDGGDLVLAVGDSGVGMAADELVDLGTPYHQTRSGKATQERGTGLGLSLVQALADMQGGDVKVQSAPNEGTTVTVRLPVMNEANVEPVDFAPLEIHQRIAAAQQAGDVIIREAGGVA